MKALLIGGCLLIGGAVAASADCAQELARLGGGISKDGSLAPLEAPDAEAGIAKDGIAKDGATMPLGTGADVATSPADVESQQQGGETAAEEAGDGRDAAIAKAHQAMAAGDEAGCMDAIKGLSPS